MNKKHLFHHWEINQCSTFLECLLYFNIFSTRKGTNLCHLTKADMVQDEVVMTLELNIPICLEKMAGNDEKIVVRQQPIFKGKVLILANNDDDKLLHKENGKSHQHNRTSRVLNTQNTKKKNAFTRAGEVMTYLMDQKTWIEFKKQKQTHWNKWKTTQNREVIDDTY